MKVELYLFLLVAVYLLLTAGAAVLVVLGAGFGLRLKRIRIFRGPTFVQFKVKGVQFQQGILPIGHSVDFYDPEEDEDEDVPPYPNQTAPADLNLVQRIIMILSGCATFAVISIGTIGFQASVLHVHKGFAHLFYGALHPFTQGADLLTAFVKVMEHSYLAGLGILSCKALVLHLLPYLGSPIFLVVLHCIQAITGKEYDVDMNLFYGVILLSPFLFVTGGWCIALVNFAIAG